MDMLSRDESLSEDSLEDAENEVRREKGDKVEFEKKTREVPREYIIIILGKIARFLLRIIASNRGSIYISLNSYIFFN